MFVLVFLYSVAFALMDEDSSGSVDKKEFGHVLESIQKRATIPHLAHLNSVSHLASAKGGMIAQFFGKDGKEELTPAKFKNFLSKMKEELVRLEFSWYDFGNVGSISARDFALSVAGCARLKHIDGYLTRIEEMPDKLADKRITYADFTAFRGVWRRLRRLSVALEFWRDSSGRDVGPEDFISVVSRVMGINLPKHVVDVVFYLFNDPEGKLNTQFMLSVMNRHFETGPILNGSQKTEVSSQRKSFFDCINECSKKRRGGG